MGVLECISLAALCTQGLAVLRNVCLAKLANTKFHLTR